MKNILKTNVKLLSVALAFTSIMACTDDDLPGLDAQAKGTVSTTVTSVTVTEGTTENILFTIAQPISKPSQFKIEKVSGSLDQGDLAIGDADTDADTGIPHVGYEITVPAYADSFEIPVTGLIDNLTVECGDQLSESGTFRITAAGVRTLLTPSSDGFLVDVTLTSAQTDYPLINWTLEAFDSYGDGWNGAAVVLTQNGTSTGYTLGDGAEEVITIPVLSNADYTFEFASGSWDGEITYVLTAPNGDQWTAGPNPPVGEITSGFQNVVCP